MLQNSKLQNIHMSHFCRIFPIRPRRNVQGTRRLPIGYPQGPRSLHFRGKRPIPRLPELASSSARPAAALRDLGEGVEIPREAVFVLRIQAVFHIHNQLVQR